MEPPLFITTDGEPKGVGKGMDSHGNYLQDEGIHNTPDALSDAIGKSMAEKILSDPAQQGTISGSGIIVSDTGMASFYDRIVPNIANEVLRKMGGGRVGTMDLKISARHDKPHVEPSGNFPEMEEITRGAGLEGAENFPNGQKPLTGNGKININGEDVDALVAVDATGVRLIGEDRGEPFELWIQNDTASQEEALNFLDHLWSGTAGVEQAWRQITVNTGQFERPGRGTSQQSFDVTPAMVEKAKAGLPLFQPHGEDARGSYQIAENLVTTMQHADKSTVAHELAHGWLEEMKLDAARPDAPADIKRDWEILRRELAIPESGDISRGSHEQFARSVERILFTGEAPSIGLRSVFERFKTWLTEIYKTVTAFGVEVNADLKAAVDRMLATDEEIQAARDLGVPRAYAPQAMEAQARKIVPGFKAEQIAMDPYADELPKGPGEAPDDSHVNYAYINTTTDVKLTMQKMAEIDQANIQKQRGGTAGVKSWEQANAEQAKYVNDILDGTEDTLRVLSPRDPNAKGPDVKLGILKKLAVGAVKDSARLRDVILAKGHDATVREQLEYLGSIERARMIQAEFLGERASVARALNAL
jgi:hypothetical protein